MKTELNMATVAETTIPSVMRPAMVNAVNAPAPAAQNTASMPTRPHILAQRTARWARRSAY